MRLYHFTSKYHLPLILDSKLYKGDVPLSKALSTQAINLTIEGRHHKQKYNRTSYFLYKGKKYLLDKTEIRITVEINESDKKLIKWSDLTEKIEMDEDWKNHLHKNDDLAGNGWYLYFGEIMPDDFILIEINIGNGKWKNVRDLKEPITLLTDQIVVKSSSEIDKNKIERIPQDEFLKKFNLI